MTYLQWRNKFQHRATDFGDDLNAIISYDRKATGLNQENSGPKRRT